MYYLDKSQIDRILGFMPLLSEACQEVIEDWDSDNVVVTFAQERILHLAIESITDIGSLLIDGFVLRDASSYEDIIEILYGEGVFTEQLFTHLHELVRLRKPLVQGFVSFERNKLHPLLHLLPELLEQVRVGVTAFIENEQNGSVRK